MEQFFTAKTIDEAVEAAAAELNIPKDSFTYEIEEYPSKGFFGIGFKPAKIKVSYSVSVEGRVKDYIHGLLQIIGVNGCTTEITNEDDHIQVQITGEEAELFLKKQGDSVEALQLLLAMTLNKEEKNKYKVSLNINNFREQNKIRLEQLASKTARQVIKSKRRVILNPMSAYQRRIIHSKLQDEKDITTYSIGEEPNRRVVVSYQGPDAVKRPDKPQAGGFRRPENTGDNRVNKPGYQNRPPRKNNNRPYDNRPRTEAPKQSDNSQPSAPRTARPGESIRNATVVQNKTEQ